METSVEIADRSREQALWAIYKDKLALQLRTHRKSLTYSAIVSGIVFFAAIEWIRSLPVTLLLCAFLLLFIYSVIFSFCAKKAQAEAEEEMQNFEALLSMKTEIIVQRSNDVTSYISKNDQANTRVEITVSNRTASKIDLWRMARARAVDLEEHLLDRIHETLTPPSKPKKENENET